MGEFMNFLRFQKRGAQAEGRARGFGKRSNMVDEAACESRMRRQPSVRRICAA